MRVRGILLAAGSGTRFGGEKMLAKMPNGNQLGATSYKNLLHAIPETSVVVNSEDTKTLKLFSSINAEIIECPEAKIGMAKSIIAGISLSPPCDGWVIALGDMPFISIETIKAVKRKLNEGALLTAPRFRGQLGHPVGFSSKLKMELMSIDGDRGARDLLQSYKRYIAYVDAEDPGVVRDIDTKDELKNIKS